MEKLGIEPATPGLQGIGLSPTQLWLTKNQSFESHHNYFWSDCLRETENQLWYEVYLYT